MNTIHALIRYLWSPNLQTWRALRRVLVARLPTGTFKERARKGEA